MKLIVPDSNIIFRALRSPNSSTRSVLLRDDCQFLTPNFLFAEIFKSKIEAYRLCHDIDEKDTPFLALTLEMEAQFWTNDEILKSGLLKKGFRDFFDEPMH